MNGYVDGDFRNDVVIRKDGNSYFGKNQKLIILRSSGSGFQSHYTSQACANCQWGVGDVDGDGRADLIRAQESRLYVRSGASGWSQSEVLWSNQYSAPLTNDNNGNNTLSPEPFYIRDADGDGLGDVLTEPKVNWDRYAQSTQFASNGKVFTKVGNFYKSLVLFGAENGDVNGDGLMDSIEPDGNGAIRVRLGKFQEPKHITAITDALGSKITIAYGDAIESDLHVPGDEAQYPLRKIRGHMSLVRSVGKDNGIGGFTTTTYRYGGAMAHLRGLGYLGFGWDEATDEFTQITTRTEYSQDFPFVGMPEAVRTFKADGTPLSETLSEYRAKEQYHVETRSDGSTLTYTTYFPYLSLKTERSYELDGSLVSTVLTDQSGTGDQSKIDDYGNVKDISVTTSAGGETFVKSTHSVYDVVDPDKWHLGRLLESTVSHTHANGTQIIRKSAFTYHPETGLLESETVEPDRPTLKRTTTYEYDTFGNKKSATVEAAVDDEGLHLQQRVTATDYGPTGKFAASVTNALGHSETRIYDDRFGAVRFLTGPNGLTTEWRYDDWGRKTAEIRADGTSTVIKREWVTESDVHAPANAIYKVSEQGPVILGEDGAVLSAAGDPVVQYYDKLGRVIRKLSTGFDGRKVYQDTEFDAQGREYRSSLPYFVGDTAYWAVNHYDEVNRVYKKTFDTGKEIITTEITFNGLTTTEINTLGQQKITVKNALGKVASVVEEEGGRVEYDYDAIGNLIHTRQYGDAGQAVDTFVGYDDVGMEKTSMDDPDMGVWAYRHNGFGELVGQTDAKGQRVAMTYDQLGRMTLRVEPDGATEWRYDEVLYGIGKLAVVSQYNITEAEFDMGVPLSENRLVYRQSVLYDSLGRNESAQTRIEDLTFDTATVYDGFGRVEKTFRPNGFEIRNQYNDYGYLLAKQSRLASIGDYDSSQLQGLLNETLASGDAAVAKAQSYAAKAAFLRAKAQAYQQAGGMVDPQGDPDLVTILAELAADVRIAADVLDNLATQALEAAEQLLVVAANVDDRIRQAGYWAASSNPADTETMESDADYITWWQATARDAAGRLSGHRSGNGLVTINDYDPATGHLNMIQTGFGYGGSVRHLEYEYDALDNVTARYDEVQSSRESFEYDRLNRLTASTIDGLDAYGLPVSNTVTYAYDALGNILDKSDVSDQDFAYGSQNRALGGNAGPHAVRQIARDGIWGGYVYDDNGNNISGSGRDIIWTSFNKPSHIGRNGNVVSFAYGPDRARYKKTTHVDFDQTVTFYLGKDYERIENPNGTVTHKHFIYTEDGLAAVHIEHEDVAGYIDNAIDETRYMHRDALGSIDTVTDGHGAVIERMGFAPFGARRAGAWWSGGSSVLVSSTNRGFTGHEHLDEVGLIHMNGRVYDPEIGRFLSADPHVQAPYNSQSYNRYSYALNNPLKYTDPSGFFFKKLFKAVKKLLKNKWVRLGLGLLAGWAAWGFMVQGITGTLGMGFSFAESSLLLMGAGEAALAGAAGGFVGGLVASGGNLRAGLVGAATGGAFGFIGAQAWAIESKVFAHGVVGGIQSEVQGGKFASGFLSGSISKGVSGSISASSSGDPIKGAVASAVVGGTVSSIGGGKFANGAAYAGFGYLFNNGIQLAYGGAAIGGGSSLGSIIDGIGVGIRSFGAAVAGAAGSLASGILMAAYPSSTSSDEWADAAATSLAVPRDQIYGPFYRRESPTQTAAVAALQVASGEVWGGVPRGGYVPTVQAYNGPLPGEVNGVEFYTATQPASGGPAFAHWYEGMPGVLPRGVDSVAIKVFFSRVTQ